MLSTKLKGFANVLGKHGVIASLAFLNDGVEHRYTGLYELKDSALRCLYLFDRDGMHYSDSFPPAPLATSFCELTMRDGFFETRDAANDERLRGRKVRDIVAYHAAAVVGANGNSIGTLAHFDGASQRLSAAQATCLKDAAQMLAQTVEPFASR